MERGELEPEYNKTEILRKVLLDVLFDKESLDILLKKKNHSEFPSLKDQEITDKLRELLPEVLEEYFAKHQEYLIAPNPLSRTIVPASFYINRLWQASDEKFYELYKKINDEFELNWNIKDLSAVFLGEGQYSGKPFKWPSERKNSELAYLLGALGNVGNQVDKKNKRIFIKTPYNNYWSYLCNFFCDSDGGNFKSRTLSSLYSQAQGNSYFTKIIEDIILDLKK